MDKYKIKEHLKEFISEAITPGISKTNDIKTKNGKINKAADKDAEKSLKYLDKGIKNDSKEVTNNKFNASDAETTYHNQMEILNGQEMLEFSLEPSKEFSDRAKEGFTGSSRMGNEAGIGNAEPTFGASSKDFAKNKLKDIKASKKKRDDAEIDYVQLGDDFELKNNRIKGDKLATEGTKTFGKIITESILASKHYTHFAINKLSGKILEAWDYRDIDNDELSHFKKDYFFNDLNDMELPLKNSDIKILSKKAVLKAGLNPENIDDWDDLKKPKKNTPTPQNTEGGLQETNNIKNNQTIKENKMKRITFKKEFKGLANALSLIPEHHKINLNEFEMTDGNESYRIRWEGNLTEGRPVTLSGKNGKMISEDLSRMKALFNYKSEDTLGLIKGNSRVNEDAVFNDILNKTKRLLAENDDMESDEETNTQQPQQGAQKPQQPQQGAQKPQQGAQQPEVNESENIEGQKPSKTAQFDKAGIAVAPEVPAVHKKKLQTKDGTAPAAPTKNADDAVNVAPEVPAVHKKKLQTKDGTAPAPKVGPWEEASVNESEDIDGQKATKTAQFDKAGIAVAPEVPAVHKKKLQTKDGTVPAAPTKKVADVPVAPEVPAVHKKKLQTKDGTAPAPKVDNLDDAGITQAAEAKKHVTMHENFEAEEDIDIDVEDGVDEPETDSYYSAGEDDSQSTEAEPNAADLRGDVPSPDLHLGGEDDEESSSTGAPSFAAPTSTGDVKLLRNKMGDLFVGMNGKNIPVPSHLKDAAMANRQKVYQMLAK
jgi:hypothetical protein